MPNSMIPYGDAGRSSFSSGEEGIYFGRRTPGLSLPVEPLKINSRSCSSGSSQVTKVEEKGGFVLKDFNTYDEFCSMLRDDYEPVDEPVQEIEVVDECASPVNPKKFSLINNWRSGINCVEIGPPKSPFLISEFASSPVAAINFAALQVTSLPPCNTETFSRVPTSEEHERPNAVVNQPTHFYDLYDAELERMIDETVDDASSSDDAVSAAVYVPPVASKNGVQRPTKLSSVIRWLPKRLKYTFLSKSSSMQRGLQARQ